MANSEKRFPLGSGGTGGAEVTTLWYGSSEIITPESEFPGLQWSKVQDYRFLIITLFQAVEGYSVWSKNGGSILIDLQQFHNSMHDGETDTLNFPISYLSADDYLDVRGVRCWVSGDYVHIACNPGPDDPTGTLRGVSISEVVGFGSSRIEEEE